MKPDNVILVKVDSLILENSQPQFGFLREQFRVNKTEDVLIFSDRIQERIFVFDSSGKYINVIGERGRGPKGIVTAKSFAIDETNQIFVFDESQRLLKIFNINGEIIYTSEFPVDNIYGLIPYELHVYNGKILNPIIDRSVDNVEDSELIAVFDNDGNAHVFGVIDPFAKVDKRDEFYSKMAIDERENLIYSNLRTSPFIQIYDLENYEQVGYFGIKSKSHKLPDKDISAYLPISELKKHIAGTTLSSGIYITDKYIIQHLQVLTEEWFEITDFTLKKNILVLYDKQTHEFVREIPVQFTLGSVRNNKLYFIENFDPDNYTIGVYEISNAK